jgi:hypothetical protein
MHCRSIFFTAFMKSDLLVAYANHNVCTVKAGKELVWIKVFDVDQGGNIKHDYGQGYFASKILWRGMLKKG